MCSELCVLEKDTLKIPDSIILKKPNILLENSFILQTYQDDFIRQEKKFEASLIFFQKINSWDLRNGLM